MPDIVIHEPRMVALSELRPHRRNYRHHPPEQLRHLGQSMRESGVYRNVVAAEDLTILGGHGVVEAAAMVGIAELPVTVLPIDADSPAALKILAGDNELARLASDDDRALASILAEVNDAAGLGDGLLGTGWTPADLAKLLESTAAPTAPDEFPEYDPETLRTDHTCPSCGYQWSGMAGLSVQRAE